MTRPDLLRSLPAIDKVLKTETVSTLRREWLPRLVDDEVRAVVAETRQRILDGEKA